MIIKFPLKEIKDLFMYLPDLLRVLELELYPYDTDAPA